MAQAVNEKYCYNCAHYLHGQLENPCAKDQIRVGYLLAGCWKWQGEKSSEENEMPTKVCPICGKDLTIDNFYRQISSLDGLSAACKMCKPKYWKDRKRKQEMEQEQ